MPPASPDRFALNPPREFGYKDWVIKLPVPQFLHHDQIAGDQRNNVRIQVLIHSVETRFGKDRCTYRFMPARGLPQPDKIEITQLYAFHEVQHWPGAFAQLEWTSFVMANIEYDDMIKTYGPSAKLSVPVLPKTALQIYQKMKTQEDTELARICQNTGKTIGQVIEGSIKLYAQNNGSQEINLNFDLLEPDTTLPMVSSPAHSDTQMPLTSSPVRKDAPENSDMDGLKIDHRILAHDSADSKADRETTGSMTVPEYIETWRSIRSIPEWQLRRVAKNSKLFAQVHKNHQAWLSRALKRLHVLCLRINCRKTGMEKVSWSDCSKLANEDIRTLFVNVVNKWIHMTKVPFDVRGARDGPIDRQIDFFCYCLAVEDPLPPQGLAHSIKARTHVIKALNWQREVIDSWRRVLKIRADEETGVRYRKENGTMLDLWTGKVETIAKYEERMRDTLRA
ncbi:hypothetical protein LTR67_007064 [Exophiala xenobiotica]